MEAHEAHNGRWSCPPTVRSESAAEAVDDELAKLRTTVRQLQYALDSRVIIEQSKGVLAERYGLTVDEAFELLRRYARSRGLQLHAVADDVVAGERFHEFDPLARATVAGASRDRPYK